MIENIFPFSQAGKIKSLRKTRNQPKFSTRVTSRVIVPWFNVPEKVGH
jgi:hypothetical protein